MAPLTVKIKHAGKVHELPLDPDQPATVFKDAVYQLTGVPPDRMKVMIKGGVLKVSLSQTVATFRWLTFVQDDTDWRKVAPKDVSIRLNNEVRTQMLTSRFVDRARRSW